MSNIQSLNHIDQEKIAHTIKFLKNEIKYGSPDLSKDKTQKECINQYCKNESTGKLYYFMKGTTDEKELFRVMPLDGIEKIYFDSQNEYNTWFQKKRKGNNSMYNTKYINGLCA